MGYPEVALEMHNKFRAIHDSPKMTLDTELNKKAKECADYYAKKGVLDYSCTKKGKAGENLAGPLAGDLSDEEAMKEAVTLWYNDNKNYKYWKVGFAQNTRHFTQLIWRGSTKLGVAVVKSGKKSFVVGLYAPAGCFPGGFPENVRPPKSTPSKVTNYP